MHWPANRYSINKAVFGGKTPLDNSEHQEDIARYVVSKAREIRELFEIEPEMETQIVSRVTVTAKGMFLYARLVMESLINQQSLEYLKKELEPNTFPEGLDKA
jgi:hypothetical protein